MDMRALVARQKEWAYRVRKINQMKDISAKEKAGLIKRLDGLSRRAMMVLLNQVYRRGPGLDPSLAPLVSVGRPRGAPDDFAKGTKK